MSEFTPWSESEDHIIRTVYPIKGSDGCLELLNRTREAIQKRAWRLRVSRVVDEVQAASPHLCTVMNAWRYPVQTGSFSRVFA